MVLKIQYRQVFGRILVYPCCDKSKTLAQLMGKKTFSETEIRVLKEKLGIGFDVIPTAIGPVK